MAMFSPVSPNDTATTSDNEYSQEPNVMKTNFLATPVSATTVEAPKRKESLRDHASAGAQLMQHLYQSQHASVPAAAFVEQLIRTFKKPDQQASVDAYGVQSIISHVIPREYMVPEINSATLDATIFCSLVEKDTHAEVWKRVVHNFLHDFTIVSQQDCVRIGTWYFEGTAMLKQNYDQAYKLLSKAVKSGFFALARRRSVEDTHTSSDIQASLATANMLLGLCYMNGYGTKQNDQKMIRHFTSAAESNNAEALYHLSQCYFHNRGVPPSDNNAHHSLALLEKSSSMECVMALYDHAERCRLGVPPQSADPVKAFHLYGSAAQKKHVQAQMK